MQETSASSNSRSASPIVSSGGAEWPLEVGVGAGALWVSSGDAIYCTTERKRASQGAPKGEKGDRREKEASGSPAGTNSTREACRLAELRQ
jgi:hypothetical protein